MPEFLETKTEWQNNKQQSIFCNTSLRVQFTLDTARKT